VRDDGFPLGLNDLPFGLSRFLVELALGFTAGHFFFSVALPLFDEDLFEGFFAFGNGEFGDGSDGAVGFIEGDLGDLAGGGLGGLRGGAGKVGAGDLEAVQQQAGAFGVE
jgi:hypothetical protein